MSRLLNHKNFIYKNANKMHNLDEIERDILELLEIKSVNKCEDVIFYDCTSLKVENLSEVYNLFYFKPRYRFKVIVFMNAEALSIVIQNKLLKSIEDSFDYIKVIFSTTQDLLPTIKSRSFQYNFESRVDMPIQKEEVLAFFNATDEEPGVKEVIFKIVESLNNNESIFVYTGLIKEKSPYFRFFQDKVNLIAELIIMYEVRARKITQRSLISRKYLGVKPTANKLILLMLELESIQIKNL